MSSLVMFVTGEFPRGGLRRQRFVHLLWYRDGALVVTEEASCDGKLLVVGVAAADGPGEVTE